MWLIGTDSLTDNSPLLETADILWIVGMIAITGGFWWSIRRTCKH